MADTVLTAIIGGVVAILTGLLSYQTAKNGSRNELFNADRDRLSKEQRELREEMRTELNTLKQEVKEWTDRYFKLEEDLDALNVENMRLTFELNTWKEKYEVLLQENITLQERVSELEEELRQWRGLGKKGVANAKSEEQE